MGIRNRPVTRLHTIPLVRTKPTSLPMVNFISAMTRKPTMVVAPLARIELQDFSMAASMAGRESTPDCLMAVYVCKRKIE